MLDIYDGEPKIYLTSDGADIIIEKGQPVMERGLENQVYISLFTREGWTGNIFLSQKNQVGSDFEKTCEGSLSVSKLVRIENAAERALHCDKLRKINADTKNPRADTLLVNINAGNTSIAALKRENSVWSN